MASHTLTEDSPDAVMALVGVIAMEKISEEWAKTEHEVRGASTFGLDVSR